MMFYESLTKLIFKRLENDDESFRKYFNDLSAKYTFDSRLEFKDEPEFNSFMAGLIAIISEITGVFRAVVR